MKHYILISLLIIICRFSNAQLPLTYGVRTTMDLYETNKLVSGNGKATITESEIDGSPYFNDEFIIGSLYTVQRIKYEDIPLRYNIYNDNLEFKTPSGEIMALASPEIVEIAIVGEIHLINYPYLKMNKIKNGFLVVIEEGKASLYSKPVIIFKKATEPAAYKQAEAAKFVSNNDEFYIRIGNEPAVIIESKKSLIAVFPDKKEKIESYIDKNKIKINKPEALREVVRFYNSL